MFYFTNRTTSNLASLCTTLRCYSEPSWCLLDTTQTRFFSVVILSCRQPHALREQVTSKWPGRRAQRKGQDGALRKGTAWYRNRKKPYLKIYFWKSTHTVYLFQIGFFFFRCPSTPWHPGKISQLKNVDSVQSRVDAPICILSLWFD